MTIEPQRMAALYAAWVVALAATLGALFIGEVLGQAPCVLCWYQRIAMFPLALILGVAAFVGDGGVRRYALPLALLGGTVALWHSGLYAGLLPEAVAPCTREGPSCTDAAISIDLDFHAGMSKIVPNWYKFHIITALPEGVAPS